MLRINSLDHLIKAIENHKDILLVENETEKIWDYGKVSGKKVWHGKFIRDNESSPSVATFFSKGDLFWNLKDYFQLEEGYELFEKQSEDDLNKIRMGFELLK